MDELYIEKVLNGDIDAFRYFVQQYKDMAFNIAMSILKSEFDAKDAVQEAFILAFRKLDTFKGNSCFSTWYYRILVNEALKIQKRQNSLAYNSVECTDKFHKELFVDSLSIPERDQQKFFVHEAMKLVPSNEALVLTLFYIEEFSIIEISDITGWSNSKIKVLLSRGRRSIYFELNKLLKSEAKQLY